MFPLGKIYARTKEIATDFLKNKKTHYKIHVMCCKFLY